MKKIIFSLLILIKILLADGLINFNTPSPPQALIPNGIFTGLDFQSAYKFIKIYGTPNTCKVSSVKDGLVGLKAHLIEPYLIAEAVKKPFYMRMLEMKLKNSAALLKKQGVLSKDGSKYVHILKFPIISYLLKSSQVNTNNVLAFAKPSIILYYMSEIDPSSWKDFLKIKMLPEIFYSISPQGLIASLVDCTAATTMNFDIAKTNKYLQNTRDMFFYAQGCNGLLSIGSNNDGQEAPFVTAINMIQSNIYEMSRYGIYKQSVESMFNKDKKQIWCSAEKGAKIKYQWLIQLARPTKGKILQSGTTSALFQDLKNNASTAGDAVFVIWKQRDYTMFAYQGGD